MLAVICLYWAAAAWWMSRMTRPMPVERFLVPRRAMTALVLAAAGLAIGVTVVIAGWRPEREPLAVLLARLGQDRRAASAISRSARDRDAQVGAVALRIGAIDRSVTRHSADLRILRRSAEEQAARVVVFAVMGFLFFPAFVYMMLTIVGVDVRIIGADVGGNRWRSGRTGDADARVAQRSRPSPHRVPPRPGRLLRRGVHRARVGNGDRVGAARSQRALARAGPSPSSVSPSTLATGRAARHGSRSASSAPSSA